ncbi:MAG: class I SAM-dependent methyltransferase [Dehalococcoidales bacterium]
MESLSFDAMAEFYDETRRFDRPSFDAALDWLATEFPPAEYPRVLEPGIGTGRIALPLAERGYRVDGIDLSPRMLAVLERRLAQPLVRPAVSYCLGDVLALPWPDASLDIAIAVHLFYHIRQWQAATDELLRVLRPGGVLALMHTGTGSEIPALNDRYRQLCGELGHAIDPIGVRSTRQVAEYLESLGYPCRRVEGRWQWVERLRHRPRQ